MDDHFTRESHGSYGTRAPMDYGSGGSGGALLFIVVLLGAVVLGSFFLGARDAPAPDGAMPTTPAAPMAPAPAE